MPTLTCPKCTKVYSGTYASQGLAAHTRAAHGVNPGSGRPARDAVRVKAYTPRTYSEGEVKCPECGQTFGGRNPSAKLGTHRRWVHDVQGAYGKGEYVRPAKPTINGGLTTGISPTGEILTPEAHIRAAIADINNRLQSVDVDIARLQALSFEKDTLLRQRQALEDTLIKLQPPAPTQPPAETISAASEPLDLPLATQ